MKLVWGNEKQFYLSELGHSFILTEKSSEIGKTQVMFHTWEQRNGWKRTIDDSWDSVPVVLSRKKYACLYRPQKQLQYEQHRQNHRELNLEL